MWKKEEKKKKKNQTPQPIADFSLEKPSLWGTPSRVYCGKRQDTWLSSPEPWGSGFDYPGTGRSYPILQVPRRSLDKCSTTELHPEFSVFTFYRFVFFFFSSFETEGPKIVQASLELVILLPKSPKFKGCLGEKEWPAVFICLHMCMHIYIYLCI